MTSENRKNIKSLILTAILCCLLYTVYFFFFATRIQIEVYNKTEFDIDSLNIDDKFYNIPKKNSLVINCRKLKMQGQLPSGTPKGKIKNLQNEKSWFLFCGTGVEEIRSGKYKFDLRVLTRNDSYLLYWKKHSE